MIYRFIIILKIKTPLYYLRGFYLGGFKTRVQVFYYFGLYSKIVKYLMKNPNFKQKYRKKVEEKLFFLKL